MHTLGHFFMRNAILHKKYSLFNKSTEIIQKSRNLHLDEEDVMVSFDVVSMFKKILFPQVLDLISKLDDLETLNLIQICLSSTLF